MNEKLQFRPRPEEGESLTSWICRLSNENKLSPYALLVKNNITSYIINSHLFDYGIKININKLSKVTTCNIDNILKATFSHIYQGKSYFNLYRKFCPKCLLEYGYFKILWQVQEVKTCEKHQLNLLDKCSDCGTRIPILNNYLYTCPKCDSNLGGMTSNHTSHYKLEKQQKIIKEWKFLFENGIFKPKVINYNEIEDYQKIAAALLYISFKGGKLEFVAEKFNLPYRIYEILISTVRGHRENLIPIPNLLHCLRLNNTSCQEFNKLCVPQYFYEQVKKKPEIDNYRDLVCQAPWCSSYKKKGSIEMVSRGTWYTNGVKHQHTLICRRCGVLYTKQNGQIKERGYWIDLAWNRVRTALINKLPTNLAEKETVSDVVKSFLFLSANSLLDEKNTYQPKNREQDYLGKLQKIYKKGYHSSSYKKAKELYGWNTADYHYYSFKSDSINLRHNYKIQVEAQVLKSKIDELVYHFKNNKEDITLKKVMSILNVSSYKLKKYELNKYVAKLKLLNKI